jgi:hypothetical protein
MEGFAEWIRINYAQIWSDDDIQIPYTWVKID